MSDIHFQQLPSAKKETIDRLLRKYRESSGYLNAYQVSKQLAKLSLSASLAPDEQIKVALLSSFTIDNIVPFLQMEALDLGIYADIYIGGINQFQFLLRNKSSDLYKFSPEIAFLVVEPHTLTDMSPIPSQQDMERALSALLEMIDDFKKTSDGILVLHSLPLPMDLILGVDFPDEYQSIVWFNSQLVHRFASDPKVKVFDMMRLIALIGSKRATDARLRIMADMEYSEEFASVLAKKYVRYLLALKGSAKKCIVLDLDNTLWGGVLGEVEKGEILLSNHGTGLPYYQFQRALLQLHNRGVILAINSKNDAAPALDLIRSHPHMILREECFSNIKINWNDKVTNMQEIAQELNLGLDSFVFLDDNPVERERVKQFLPTVLVPDLPSDPNEYQDFLDSLAVFEKIHVTEEDRKRSLSYKSQVHRERLKQKAPSYEEFLRSLNTQLKIRHACPKDIPRLAQMCQRTNQFNMTTKRYTEADLSTMLQDESRNIYVLSVKDKFDDSGLVGLAIIDNGGKEWTIDTLLMSCRVLGRSIESAFLKEILQDAKNSGAIKVIGIFRSTSKNSMCAHFYLEAGFKRTNSKSDEYWHIDPAKTNLSRDPYFSYAE